MSIWATENEIRDRFLAETLPNRGFRVYDEWDNGEFMTGAKVDLIEDGRVVHTETFCASSEDAPGPGYHAGTQAQSYAWAWLEAGDASRLEPFGLEWQREQAEAQ